MALQVVSARLPSEAIVQGVTVEPYVVCRRADATNTCTAEDVPEEGLDSQSRFALRFRWYRSVVNRGGAVCWVHGDREATLQCVLCLRAKVDVRKSFHCSTDCLRRHWGLHKELHGQSNRFNGETFIPSHLAGSMGSGIPNLLLAQCQPVTAFAQSLSACAGYTGSENGFQSDKSFKTGHTFSNNGETWIEVLRCARLGCLHAGTDCAAGGWQEDCLAQAGNQLETQAEVVLRPSCRWLRRGSTPPRRRMSGRC